MRLAHVEARLEQQIALNNLIATSYDNLVKVGIFSLNPQRIQARLTALKEDWEKFSIVHEALTIAIPALNPEDKLLAQSHVYFKENFFATTRELYLETVERMNLLLNTGHGTPQEPLPRPRGPHDQFRQPYYSLAKLPRMDLPKFNGTSADWLHFKDLFNSLVLANPTLTSVEKLQYLKTSLVGSAAQLLKDTATTEDNFNGAWEALIDYYENKRELVDSTLQSLVNLKRMTKESAAEIERVYTSLMQIYRSLKNLQRPVETWDDILVFLAVQRLDSETIKLWGNHLGASRDPPTWKQFSEFLFSRKCSLQSYEKKYPGKLPHQASPKVVKTHYQGQSSGQDSSKGYNCPLCSAKHHPAACPQYSSKTIQQKMTIINKHRLCFNCLGTHRVAACKTTRRCVKCGRKHHTTIHPGAFQANKANSADKENTKPSTITSNAEGVSKSGEAKVLHSSTNPTTVSVRVLLATARVRLTSSNGNVTVARALIDQGSEISLISERIVQRLKMERTHSSISLVGIGAKASNKTRGMVSLQLSPHFPSDFTCPMTAHVLTNLTSSIPSVYMNEASWPHLEGLQLADAHFSRPDTIDLILGADVYGSIITDGLIKESQDSPIAQRTELGWIISGPTSHQITLENPQSYHVTTNEDLHSMLQRFWQLEEVPSSTERLLTPEEQECESHFQTTHTRDQHGRYVVRLPFKQPANLLGESRGTATRLIYQLNKRFVADSTYAKMYSDFIAEYLHLEHMELLSSSQPEPPSAYYLPHHGVLKEASLTTKLRVVFNGSSKTTSGFSLNDLLHVGPKLQNNLFDVLIWFRQSCYVFSSDIEKMYRQINVHKDDWPFQRILWLDETNNLVTYQLTTVTYGLGCAPFLALRAISQLIQDEGQQYPLAVPVLKCGRYVDDLFGGADSIEQAQAVVQQISQLCMAGGFHLQKWASNHPEVLSSIPQQDQIPLTSIPIQENLIIHSLGLSWQPSTDTFKFFSNEELPKSTTKRMVLSTIAKLFDPLGLLSPVIIGAKILMQEIWTLRLDWDDPIPPKTADKWTLFIKGLQDLSTLEFPRWLGLKSNQTFEIHGFADASSHAYAAVIFCRSISDNGTTYTHLICSKAKVAPLKRMTIPRLELAGAVLVTKLVTHLLKLLNRDQIPVYLWTDSTVAYTWITNHPSRWKDFVHNRVCYIQESLPQAQWRFVSGLENPADLATRGLTPSQLATKGSWWSGPSWLSEPSHDWPQKPTAIETGETLEERPNKVVTTCVNTIECWDLLRRYSSLRKLIKITAVCQRAIKRFKKVPNSSLVQPITTTELQMAKRLWVSIVQGAAFPQELKVISSGKSLPSTHPLTRLTPFVDSDGVLRVGGRLQEASLTMENKHPAILPKDSPLTNLVVADAHLRTLHGGTQLTLCTIREEYWIIGGRAPVRSFILKCIQCTRFRRKRAQQLMGQLPRERVTPSRPFMNSGIDYAGPFSLKTWRGRNARTYKAYIALFVCLSTSAIHLELVTDYTAEAFIAAYKRFSGRRGICATLWSDCGTNFKGAEAVLQRLFTDATAESQHLASLLAKDGTQWRFNPPSAPHFGGKWEAGVKSVKHHFYRVIGEALLTYEEMNTLLIQIEAILNSRPLTPCTDDPEDLSVLTPGHFLMGCAPAVVPEPSLDDVRLSRLSRWQLIRQMVDGFWTRWSRECLQRYHAISKWTEKTSSIREGSMVLVVDERYPPAKWPLGRVIETHPGKDGLVRVATVKTLASTLTRPIVKLCPLPIQGDTM